MDGIVLLERFLQQGGAVAIAGLLIFFYRRDLLVQRDFARETIDRLMHVVEDNTKAMSSLREHLERVSVCPVFESEMRDVIGKRQQRLGALDQASKQ